MATDTERVRTQIADFCRRSISASGKWRYTQARPMSGLGVPPEKDHWNDCSGHSTLAYFWAKKQTGIDVPDPNHSGYNGYGYTGTLIDNPRVSGPYEVGDLGLYGPSTGDTRHVVTCYRAGSSATAYWSSHGSSSGPYAVALHYRGDLLCVVRPVLVPAGGDEGKEEPVEAWVADWLDWYIHGQYHDPTEARPAAAPKEIPQDVWDLEKQVVTMLKRQGADPCFQKWMEWKDAGEPSGKRPDCAPEKVYEEWHEARARAV